ncbi:mycothiol synthase [Miniimonas arenae]|uniref:Mycothiol synthase n=1 Tax=Miniimonas arenae TaxID=676201 RepID=A0A5C5BDC2_9MICO|nr:mycothiol synthase [Miniimonas arenae]TNU76425.1 mycothiol synthase [Miniimonas arenae]
MTTVPGRPPSPADRIESGDAVAPGPLHEVDRRAVLALAARAQAHDGVAPLSEEHLLALRTPEAHVLVHREAGAIVAAASRSGSAAEVVVDPARRRRGHGAALVAGVLAQDPNVGFWAHGDLPGARALAASAGLEAARSLLVLERPVGPADLDPDVAGALAAAGLTVTTHADAVATDAGAGVPRPSQGRGAADALLSAWLELNALAFADHPEQGRWTRADLDARLAEPWYDPALLAVATRAGAVVGSVWVKPVGPERAEIYVLAAHPASGGGVGRALLRWATAQVAARGATSLELYVDGANTRARALYERTGYAERTRDVQYLTLSRPPRGGVTIGA